MSLTLHPLARTTPRTRAELKAEDSTLSNAALARLYGVSAPTARKWRNRDSVADLSHRPNTLHCTLTKAQEAVAMEVRRTLWLPLDDLLVVVREFLNPKVSRSGLARCLDRYKLNRRPVEDKDTPVPVKTFKDYAPGFLHVDIKYLPQMADETARRYLFVAIDRATRWVFMRIYADQSEVSSTDFLRRLKATSPMKIEKVLTDNGSQFTDRFTNKTRKPSGNHVFDKECVLLGIEHRLSPPRHPQTNGMVERFNGRISEVLATTHFRSRDDLQTTLERYEKLYNDHLPQRALGHRTPLQAIRDWQTLRPELFNKKRNNQAGLDTYAIYCYCVIPVYLICFYLVLRSFHQPPLDKIPEGENSAKAFYKKRFIVFAVAFYTMIMVSLYLPKYFFTQRQTHDLTMLAVFDIIEMWCQALFLGMCISSIRDYKKEAAVLR